MGFDWRGLLLGSQGDPNRNKWEDADYIRTQAQQGIAGAQNRQAPQAAGTTIGNVRTGTGSQVATGRSDQFRDQQMGLAQQLQGVISGQQKGAGELAVERQAGRALGQAAGAATMARGAGAAGGARAAARASGAIGLGAAGQAQQAAMGDQMGARQQLAGILGQGREQDIGIAGQNANLQQSMNMANLSAENQRIFQQAGLDQATSLANMQARLQAMGMNDAAIANYLQQLGVMNQGQMAARGADNGIAGQLLSAGGQAIGALV